MMSVITLAHNEVETQVAAPFVAGALSDGVGNIILHFHIVVGAFGEQTDRELHLKVALVEHQPVTAGHELPDVLVYCSGKTTHLLAFMKSTSLEPLLRVFDFSLISKPTCAAISRSAPRVLA